MRKKVLVLSLIVGVILLLGVAAVSAHEGREVGDYLLEFGWRVEPALAGYPNGPEVYIAPHAHEEGEADHDHEEADPLAGVEINLQVEVTFGPASTTLTLEPAWGETGHYIADLIPTRPGDYQFRVFGTIGDIEVDELFDSSAGEFSSVAPASDVTFPDAIPSVVELLEQIAALEARIAALEAK